MKIRIDVEAKPEELRAFFGLPDVAPLQRELMERLRAQMEQGVKGFEAAALLAPLLPEHLRSLEAVQRAFWSAATGRGGEDEKEAGG
ncbi:DUF6489 family protein [Inmirania thermothiophila]|uniref:Uncharacterized protein n=1 Tax=Inmirania thermothiophila TaxID=1750597 RepID=A0A3N1Y495_9GAMM|nr:DUF6489 family protein [Inmirania thermothiophila]ROR32097.1 hypothetical protein EDC57_1287 [Inmirania thermothiophila]